MNYQSLTDDELERLAHIGDRNAVFVLGERAAHLEPAEDIEDAREEAYEDGYADGKDDLKHALAPYADNLREAIGSLDGEIVAELRALLTEIEL
jgi:flagellar biosynthesis/type III secretory pathway protein FliH